MIENRRKFLAQSSLFATFAISGTKSSGKIIGANERINVAVCGIKGRGTSHMGGHGRQKNVVISHLVDPDSRLHEARKKFIISKKDKSNITVFSDFRHGIFNPNSIQKLLKAIPKKSFKTGDSQVASRWGNITEFKNFDLITPNEREARFSLADQDSTVGNWQVYYLKKQNVRT